MGSNQMERIKRRGGGVNFKAEAGAEGEPSAVKLSLAVSHSFDVFPGLRTRNQSNIPARRERRIKGSVFCAHPIGRSPAGKCRISKQGARGASAAKQEVLPIGRDRGLPGEGCLLPGKFPSRYVVKCCICWGPSGLSKPENSEAPFSKTFQHGCVGV